jgi:hypothetical protein
MKKERANPARSTRSKIGATIVSLNESSTGGNGHRHRLSNGEPVRQSRENSKAAESAADSQKPTQADKLVALASEMELFHSLGADPAAFVSFTRDGHRETWPVNSSGFKEYLSKRYFLENAKAPSAHAVADAANVLSGQAKFAGPARPVAIRVAEHEGKIYLDLADEKWQAVEISADGWRVVSEPPVRFIRRRGMRPIPTPELGGSVEELRPLVNLPDDDSWRLFVAWLVGALRPNRPFTVLAVSGEHGSAKSTLCRMARRLIDPSAADLRRPPKDERDLMIAANNGWVIALENVSGLPASISDALCALATGGGYAARQLYTDDEERIIDAMRPVLLNGIEDVPSRSDLIDRSILLALPAIDDDRRRTEADLWSEFDRIRPRVLGALLTAVSAALKNLPQIHLPDLPRMADFAGWVTAAESALPWPAGAIMTAYRENRKQSNSIALEAATLAPALATFVKSHPNWTGTVKELLQRLNNCADANTQRQQGWPKTAKALGGELRRLAPNLRQIGIEVAIGTRTGRGTPVILRWTKVQRSQSSPAEELDNIDPKNTHVRDSKKTAANAEFRTDSIVDSATQGLKAGHSELGERCELRSEPLEQWEEGAA